MVDILLYWFRFAEASRKCHMVQMNKYLKKKSAKNPPHSFHVVAMQPQATQKAVLGQGIPPHSPCPQQDLSPAPRRLPGSSRVPGAALLCLPLGLGF